MWLRKQLMVVLAQVTVFMGKILHLHLVSLHSGMSGQPDNKLGTNLLSIQGE